MSSYISIWKFALASFISQQLLLDDNGTVVDHDGRQLLPQL